MARRICIFEDTLYSQFLPIAYFRPVYDLRCGIVQLKTKIINLLPKADITLQCRAYLAEYVRAQNSACLVNEIPEEECLFINGRVLAAPRFMKTVLAKKTTNIVFIHGHHVVAAVLHGENLKKIKNRLAAPLSPADFGGIAQEEIEADMACFPWDLVHKNGDELIRDFLVLAKRNGSRKRMRGKIHAGTQLLAKKNIIIESGAVVYPGCVLDAENGPIYIGKNVKVFPQVTIIGPAAVLDHSSIKTGAQIYEKTTIGPMCKIGGEVEGSIIQGYTNKQHAGFLGHSYLGSWVNLGAGTNTSDLKNNYSSVKVVLGGKQFDTGLQFVGLLMGDHSKSSINSMFNTGTVVGVCCNIFGSRFPAKYVPSFSWGVAGDETVVYNIEKAIAVGKKVMERRNIEMTESDVKMFRLVYEMTTQERTAAGVEEKSFKE